MSMVDFMELLGSVLMGRDYPGVVFDCKSS
jgi:hypothetical protein